VKLAGDGAGTQDHFSSELYYGQGVISELARVLDESANDVDYLKLCEISVANGASSISSGNITDGRVFATPRYS
jgi:hypothetical protein